MNETKLSPIVGCNNPHRSGDVIFMHGLGGHAYDTWHPNWNPNKPSSDFWLTWLGEERPDLAIWSLGYDIAPFAWRGKTMPLLDRGANILDRLTNYQIGSKPTLFVTHSMGGLIVKQMLRYAKDVQQISWQRVLDNTAGIVFISTPHSGSTLANWVKLFGDILQSTVSVDELQAHHPHLRELNTVFRNDRQLCRIPMQVYFETRPTKGIRVVNETSSDPGIMGTIPIPIDADHLSICRPESRDSQIYLGVKNFLNSRIEYNIPSTSYQNNKENRDENPHRKPSKKKINYQQLISSLRQGDLEKADTDTLDIFLSVTNRTRDGWLRSHDVSSIPCDVLIEIDDLWRQASEGNFGLSAQKQVWIERGCGIEQFTTKAFRNFGEEVGWFRYENNQWLKDHKDFSFSLDAQRGHLPSLKMPLNGNQMNWWTSWQQIFRFTHFHSKSLSGKDSLKRTGYRL